ncbi:hypothetical protein Rhe02_86880 [Rhizocola hellebori]|uniref:AAA family ATPase n=1 Tax=Rhizocola hellebori TaxID=1392758 RepID=A0A8J3QHB6_9ACTN|nr:AAA domain-containing protein [Rhizocola hellebori]GIH10621.1 hypothetical protein Rhe02_86880 [Rhizocola hellebori]
MRVRMVHLSRPIALIPSEHLVGDAGNDPAPVLREIDQLAAQGNLPATLGRTGGGWRMALHTSRHVAWLHPTPEQDAFLLGEAFSRRFGDEDRLAAGALLLRATFHQLSLREALPADQLWREWDSLPAAAPGSGRTPRDTYLDALELAVQASRHIEITRQRAVAPQRYVSRAHSGGGVYSFQLARSGALAANSIVCVGEAREVTGRVVGGYGRMVTVRFSADADHERIRSQGTLLVMPSDRAHAARGEALARLRRGDARNPGLLGLLTEETYSPYQPRADVQPGRSLDPDQLDVFQRALAVPDLLTVLGPPGTGKTTTIVEVVTACAREGQRVLVTAPTHRAVDDVLESLPPELSVVRVGAEDAMSSKVKALTLAGRAEAVRRGVLADTAMLDTLTEAQRTRPVLEWHLAHLHSQLQIVQTSQDELVRTEAAIADALKKAEAALRAQLTQAERDSVRKQSILATTEAGLTQAYRSAVDAQARADRGTSLAFAYRWHASQQRRRSERLAQALPSAKTESEHAQALRAKLRDEFETLVAHDPQVLELRAAHERARHALDAAWPEIRRAGQTIGEMLQASGVTPAAPADTTEGWTGFHTACVATISTLERRAGLLRDWHAKLADETTSLETEVAHYSDVVAVTCLGTETATLIGELSFDLAVVDEAGRVGMPDLLVPLVRTRRAVLVGDHTQPPPVSGAEVQRWAAGLTLAPGEPERVTEVLAHSGFEPLFRSAPEPNGRWLQTQRRMPAEIAEFVSATSYQGRLRSQHRGRSPDPLFSSPFAMVDTAGATGEAEAELIAQLIAHSHHRYRDWAVTVGSRAQRELVVARLQDLLGATARVSENVSSADEFRNGECDLVVVALTGNSAPSLQPRQFSATITRTRRQLVLVGDLDVLRAARDNGFHAIVAPLLEHLGHRGDLRDSSQVLQALSAMAGHRS